MSITGVRASAFAGLAAAAVLVAGCSTANKSAGQGATGNGPGAIAAGLTQGYGTEQEETGTGPMVTPTVPVTPSVNSYYGALTCKNGATPPISSPAPAGCTRVFHLTAEQFVQHIANFPLTDAGVWGYAAPGQSPSTPGPTLISYKGEQVQLVETNKLPEPTTIHPHGLHQPNVDDGVAVIDQTPTPPGATFAYPPFTPGHVGTFGYRAPAFSVGR